MKNKLYMMKENNGKVLAITEDEYHLERFFYQNEYDKDKIKLFIVTDKKTFNKLMVEYEDKILEECGDSIVTREYIPIVYHTMKNESSRLSSLVYDLNHVKNNFDLNDDEIKKISKAIKVIKSIAKPKRFFSIMGLVSIVKSIYKKESSYTQQLDNIETFKYKIHFD